MAGARTPSLRHLQETCALGPDDRDLGHREDAVEEDQEQKERDICKHESLMDSASTLNYSRGMGPELGRATPLGTPTPVGVGLRRLRRQGLRVCKDSRDAAGPATS